VRLTSAAAAVETAKFETGMLADVAARSDALGQLARVFVRMAGEVAAREAQLQREIQVLRIEIDEVQKARQVSEITETDYFQSLRLKARALRQRPTS
jgi:hypothetical protein